MSVHAATIRWQRDGQEFTNNRYSRGHTWEFDGGAVVPASASPHVVPLPMSIAENVDPEEAFVAAISSCHMLVFLSIAAKRGYVVDDYHDQASGVMAEDEQGRMAITNVTLRPAAIYSGDKRPTRQQVEKMHHRSHQLCFIANSVKTVVETEVRD
jgi:organic hydroperoxide reductase OsmC/OhrA